MTTHTDLHPIARSYLERLAEAARVLPPEDARELVTDIATHLAEALPATASEAEARTVLDRLGTPHEIVAAAGAPLSPVVPGQESRGGRDVLALALLIGAELLFVVWFVAIPMWLVGLVLLAMSSAWTGREKLLGLLALGTGLPVILLSVSSAAFVSHESCTGGGVETATGPDGTVTTTPIDAACTTTGGPSTWVSVTAIALLVAYVAWQAWTVWRLSRQR